eukprot:CAMPEP_0115487506 /NCGR_PEP_ID=MMETSP0271-20121206/60990_1 /TAXON_ID=71861 /ORGANISM="Scrippsiella trochoidea, Strain CCMP3099" /LENGTH=31 /DNA_ID= /DNA_START= /DNA_END= /DNA_ORIENTATION=
MDMPTAEFSCRMFVLADATPEDGENIAFAAN